MRKRIVAGNWKMNKTPAEALALINELKGKINTDKADVVLCVPALSLTTAAEALKGTNIRLGAQNMHFEDSGAFTGETSAPMLTAVGAKYVIIGHSERRAYFAETNETVNKKVKKALEHGLTPIMCVGETLIEREQGVTIELVRLQTRVGLLGVSADDVKNTVIAYEPVWAIGTGKTATDEQAEEACAAIRRVIAEIYGGGVAEAVRIQYGGSVTAANAAALFGMGNIDGGLVGGASLKAEFADIVNC